MRKGELIQRMCLHMMCSILEGDGKPINKILAEAVTMGPHASLHFMTAMVLGFELFSAYMTRNSSHNRKLVRSLVRAMRDGDCDTYSNCNGGYYDSEGSSDK